MSKPAILVARSLFPEVIERLRLHFDVELNGQDTVWTSAELIQRLQGKAGLLLTGSETINDSVLRACRDLRAICSIAVGYNNIDVAACTAHRVLVSNAPDVLTETTADFGFALMMAAARRISESEHFLRQGLWHKSGIDLYTGQDIHGKTLGIFGMGRIGQAIARRGALGFGMKVIYHNRSPLDTTVEQALHARYVSLHELLQHSDHVLITVPYSSAVHHAIGAAELALMKPSATLTNIARGGIVDDAALAQALQHKQIAAAGLDVYEGEPKLNPALLTVPNIVLTPHIASASIATRHAMANLAADNLIAVLGTPQRQPPTALNPEVLTAINNG